jgi:AcrR family transcriptional regulator
MQDEKQDRRVQRTRKLLRGALVQLVKERGYDSVTIQDITERANLGRTTFYLHYLSKEDLMLDHHFADMVSQFKLGIFSRDELMSDEPQPEMVAYLELLLENRNMYLAMRETREATVVLRGIRQQLFANLENSLRTVFPDAEPAIPMEVLTAYIVGAQESLVQWWLNTRTAYNAQQLAGMLHHLRQVAIFDAYSFQKSP